MVFLTLDFWWWVIRIAIPMLAFMTLFFAISPTWFCAYFLLYSREGNWKDINGNREHILTSKSGVERGMFKALFAMSEDRPLTAGVSMLVMLFSAFLW
jgi:hypothetical protein